MGTDLWRRDAVALAAAIRTGAVSSREATQAVLARLEAVNPKLNAVTVVLAEQALAAADRADGARRRGEVLGPLHGVPVTIKENIDQEGTATANGVAPSRTSLGAAGYAVEEVEPPDVDGAAACWAAIVINEVRHVTQPHIRQHGGVDINRSLDFTLAGTPRRPGARPKPRGPSGCSSP